MRLDRRASHDIGRRTVNPSWTKTLPLAALCATSILCLAGAPSMASADTRWLVDATFDDGTTLTGTFTLNVYGFLESANLETVLSEASRVPIILKVRRHNFVRFRKSWLVE